MATQPASQPENPENPTPAPADGVYVRPRWVRRYPPTAFLSAQQTQECMRLFLDSYEKWGNFTEGSRAANVSVGTIQVWMRDSPEFAADVEEAKLASIARLEKEARKRAIVGTREPVFHKGVVVGHVRKKSDPLAMFLLKAECPEKYRDRVEHSGPNGGPIQTQAEISVVQVQLVLPGGVEVPALQSAPDVAPAVIDAEASVDE